jgi:hypothetical protein
LSPDRTGHLRLISSRNYTGGKVQNVSY